MKKAVALLLALIMVLAFCACGQQTAPASDKPAETTAQEPATDNAGTPSRPVTKEDLTCTLEKTGIDKISGVEWEGPTEKAGAPKPGTKLALIPYAAALEGCAQAAAGVANACEYIGWEYQLFDGAGTPNGINEAFMSAIAWGADCIVIASTDPSVIQLGMKAAYDAGIPVASVSNGDDTPNEKYIPKEGEYWPFVDCSIDEKENGQCIANWIRNDANDEGHVLLLGDNSYTSCKLITEGVVEGFEGSNMKISDVKLFTTVDETLTNMVISYLTANPDCKYIYVPYDPAAAAIVEALTAVGITDVKLASTIGAPQNLNYIRNGQIQALDMCKDSYNEGWATLDQIIRYLNGKPLAEPHSENLAWAGIDATNCPEEGKVWTADTIWHYRDKYLELWTD